MIIPSHWQSLLGNQGRRVSGFSLRVRLPNPTTHNSGHGTDISGPLTPGPSRFSAVWWDPPGADGPAAPAGRFASRELVSILRSHDWPARRGFVRLAPAASGEPLNTTMSATGRTRALRSDDTDARKATVRRFGRSHRSAQAIV